MKYFAIETKKHFIKHCQEKFKLSVENDKDFCNDPIKIVQLLFELLHKLDYMKETCFCLNRDVAINLDAAFKEALNENELINFVERKDEILPTSIALYSHQLLKKQSKLETDQEKLKAILQTIGKLLTYVDNRDVFELKYQKNFQDRLVFNQVESEDLENYMIQILGNICDRQVTHKLLNILSEFHKSSEILDKFKVHCNKQSITLPKFDINLIIFSQSTADVIESTFNPPQQIALVYKTLQDYYIKSQNKKLKINDIQTTGVLQFQWMKRPIQITCRYYQIGIMLLFNDKPELTFLEIQQLTGLDSDNAKICLSGPVSKGLLQNSTGKSFTPSSVIKFNLAFKPKVTKFSVMPADKKYTERLKKKEDDQIDKELEHCHVLADVAYDQVSRGNAAISESVKVLDRADAKLTSGNNLSDEDFLDIIRMNDLISRLIPPVLMSATTVAPPDAAVQLANTHFMTPNRDLVYRHIEEFGRFSTGDEEPPPKTEVNEEAAKAAESHFVPPKPVPVMRLNQEEATPSIRANPREFFQWLIRQVR